jgi:hypothetical protein
MSIFAPPTHGSFGIDTGNIANSLRFRGTQYLSFVAVTPTNNNKWKAVIAFKRGSLGVDQALFGSWKSGTSLCTQCYFDTSNRLRFFQSDAGGVTKIDYVTNRVFRDPTSWQFLSIDYDNTLATTSVVIRIDDDAAESSFATSTNSAVQNGNYSWNQAGLTHYIGAAPSTAGTLFGHLSGYAARACGVDGSLPAYTSFGYLNSDINEWISKTQSEVKAVVDAGGANSFMLDFDAASSTTTLGYDKSAKGNNWTLNNFSLTAGVTYDHMLDVPGCSYAVLNPIRPSGSGGFSNGNLTGTSESGTSRGLCSTMILDRSLVWYAEVDPSSSATNWFGVTANDLLAADINTAGQQSVLYYSNGNKYVNGSASAYGASYTTENIGILFDGPNNRVKFFKGTTDNGWITLPSSTVDYVFCQGNAGGGGVTANWNFGQRSFTNKTTNAPTALALCQGNLPDPAILNPREHFDVKLRSGTSATATVTGIQFPPDLVWTKSRSAAYGAYITDSVRGATKALIPSITDPEYTSVNYLNAFNSDGYTLGTWASGNETGQTYVDWLWKAGGTGVTNTAGSITSTVSANVEAGFSIVTYTGNSTSGATIGHGLGKKPSLVVVHEREFANAWCVYHSSVGATKFLYLNQTDVATTQTDIWNNTEPTAAVFSVGNANATNRSTKGLVAYCFAEIPGYSKIGSVPTNGVANDGYYVDLGFKPRFILFKASNKASEWHIYDAARSTYNAIQHALFPNASVAESFSSGGYFDVTSRGFKWRNNASELNNSASDTILYYAIAGTTGKYSNAR